MQEMSGFTDKVFLLRVQHCKSLSNFVTEQLKIVGLDSITLDLLKELERRSSIDPKSKKKQQQLTKFIDVLNKLIVALANKLDQKDKNLKFTDFSYGATAFDNQFSSYQQKIIPKIASFQQTRPLTITQDAKEISKRYQETVDFVLQVLTSLPLNDDQKRDYESVCTITEDLKLPKNEELTRSNLVVWQNQINAILRLFKQLINIEDKELQSLNYFITSQGIFGRKISDFQINIKDEVKKFWEEKLSENKTPFVNKVFLINAKINILSELINPGKITSDLNLPVKGISFLEWQYRGGRKGIKDYENFLQRYNAFCFLYKNKKIDSIEEEAYIKKFEEELAKIAKDCDGFLRTIFINANKEMLEKLNNILKKQETLIGSDNYLDYLNSKFMPEMRELFENLGVQYESKKIKSGLNFTGIINRLSRFSIGSVEESQQMAEEQEKKSEKIAKENVTYARPRSHMMSPKDRSSIQQQLKEFDIAKLSADAQASSEKKAISDSVGKSENTVSNVSATKTAAWNFRPSSTSSAKFNIGESKAQHATLETSQEEDQQITSTPNKDKSR